MSTITIRLNQDEKRLFEEYAKLQDQPLSTLLKKALAEKIEDEFDLDVIITRLQAHLFVLSSLSISNWSPLVRRSSPVK